MIAKSRTIALLLLSLLLMTGQVAAQSAPSKASLADWEARFGVLVAVVVFILIVNTLFLVPAIRRLRAHKHES